MNTRLRAVLIVTLAMAMVATFMDFAWDLGARLS